MDTDYGPTFAVELKSPGTRRVTVISATPVKAMPGVCAFTVSDEASLVQFTIEPGLLQAAIANLIRDMG